MSLGEGWRHPWRGQVTERVPRVTNPICRLIVVGASVMAIAAGCSHFGPGDCPQPETSTRAKVRVSWSVESSQDLYGFIIYRGRSPNGPWTRVNSTPILAAEGGTTNIPHDYEYIDKDESIVPGQQYWYWLEGVDSDGSKRPVKWPPEMVVPKVRINEDFPPLKKM
jgi:hypothetical protein